MGDIQRQRGLCFWVWPPRPPSCPGLPRGRCVIHVEDKESQRRGTERGGDGRTERGGDGEGELAGGHPSNLLSIFSFPAETQRKRE